MKTKTPTLKAKQKSAIGIRPKPEIRAYLEKLATDERRTMANVAVYIVDKVLSTTKGSLHFKVTPESRAA